MPDGDEQALSRKRAALPVLLHNEAGQLLPAQQLRDLGVEHEFHVLALRERLDQLLLAAKFASAVHEPDLAAALAEEQRVLQGAVAAAADGDRLAGVKGAVADRAVAHAAADQLLLALDAERTGARPGREDQRAALKHGAGLAAHAESPVGLFHGGRLVKLDLGALLHGLLQQPVAQLRAGDRQEAGIILHLRGPGDLPAEGVFFDDQHALARTAGVGRRGQPRGAAADDDDIIHSVSPHKTGSGRKTAASLVFPVFSRAGC